MRFLVHGAVLLVVAACAGCTGAERPDRGGDATPEVRDSAGIRLVTYAPPEPWTMPGSLVEELRIGELEGGARERLFGLVAGGMILDDGSIVVADRQAGEVRRFAPDGTFLESHGSEGEGPEEYEYIVDVDRCRATGFTVFDIGWTRTQYDSTGGYIDERPVRIEGGSTPYRLACHPSGRMAVTNWDVERGPRSGFHTAPARLRILNAEGEEVADLGERIGSERWGTTRGSGPHPAGRSTMMGFTDDHLIVTDGSVFGFERWSLEGRLGEIVRVDVEPPDVDSLAAAWIQSELAALPEGEEELRRRTRERVEAIEWPERSAFFVEMAVTDDRVLLQEVPYDGEGRWFVFAAGGEPLGYLPLPPGASLLDVKGDRILVAERTALDVPQVVLYSLEARGTDGG